MKRDAKYGRYEHSSQQIALLQVVDMLPGTAACMKFSWWLTIPFLRKHSLRKSVIWKTIIDTRWKLIPFTGVYYLRRSNKHQLRAAILPRYQMCRVSWPFLQDGRTSTQLCRKDTLSWLYPLHEPGHPALYLQHRLICKPSSSISSLLQKQFPPLPSTSPLLSLNLQDALW